MVSRELSQCDSSRWYAEKDNSLFADFIVIYITDLLNAITDLIYEMLQNNSRTDQVVDSRKKHHQSRSVPNESGLKQTIIWSTYFMIIWTRGVERSPSKENA